MASEETESGPPRSVWTVWADPYLRLSAAPAGRRQAFGAVAVGAAAAVLSTFALELAGWLEGPVLFGGTALGESLLVAGFAAAVALVIASVTRAPPLRVALRHQCGTARDVIAPITAPGGVAVAFWAPCLLVGQGSS